MDATAACVGDLELNLETAHPLGAEMRVKMANKIEAENLTNRGRGRPKGSANKVTKAAKDAIADAAEQLGGTNRLAAWAKENEKNEHSFWTNIYPKLLPLQVAGELAHSVKVTGALKWQPPQ